ncbi:MAG: hypothetical protein KDK70_36145, partial [Myxococcales bacterium]|nr:hypothetical protein [Myxococcales bacterium]
MAPMDQVALRLRFRERHHSAQPPDIESFRRPAAPADVGGRARRTASIGVVRGRRPQAPHAPLVIFFQYASHGIPALGQGTERPDPSSWSIRPTVFGYLASVPRSRRTSSRS